MAWVALSSTGSTRRASSSASGSTATAFRMAWSTASSPLRHTRTRMVQAAWGRGSKRSTQRATLPAGTPTATTTTMGSFFAWATIYAVNNGLETSVKPTKETPMKRYRFTKLTLVTLGVSMLAVGTLGAASPRNLVPQVQASADDTFIEINHPKGVRGTRAWSLDAQGDVIGSYEDAHKVRHGFFWHDGRFTTIDHPKAGHGRPGPLGPQGSTLYDINGFGDLIGRYIN